ncbi:MAG: major facilitator superfamily 1 [Chloroflexi bacterium]|nr:major facilitator superfamily 1 [Chloroflexota bacterium]
MEADDTPPSGAQRFPAFGSHRFRLFFAGHMFANVGAWMEIVATGWLVLELTDSPAALGLNAALQAVPVIALSLVGGMVADRMDRYQLILRTQFARLVLSTAMAVLVGSGQVQVWHIYVYSVLSSMVSGLTVPPRQALVPRLVPPEALLSAMALNSVLWQGAPILGPSLAGLILAFSGIAGCFYANVAGEVINLAAMFGLRLGAEEPKEAKGSLWLTRRSACARRCWRSRS